MVRRTCRVLGLALALLAGAALDGVRAENGAFFAAIEDLPLMPGLREADEDVLVFDSPSGRIVQALATGAVTREQVVEFYAATLPQLGWVAAGPRRFRREGEVLTLDFPPPANAGLDDRGLVVRFDISPAAGGAPAPADHR